MGAPRLCIRLKMHHCLFVQVLDLLKQLRVFLLNFFAILVDFLELLWELGETLQKLFHHDYAKHEAFSIPTESLYNELECDSLQHVVEKAILDYGTEEFGNFSEVDMRVLVQESVLIEESVEHARVYFLLFHDLRFLKALESDNQLLNAFVDFVRLCTEYMLEVLVGGLVNLFRRLSRSDLPREQDSVLCH